MYDYTIATGSRYYRDKNMDVEEESNDIPYMIIYDYDYMIIYNIYIHIYSYI